MGVRKIHREMSILMWAVRCIHEAGRPKPVCSSIQITPEEVFIMRFLSIYKSPERSTPPTPEEMCSMGKR